MIQVDRRIHEARFINIPMDTVYSRLIYTSILIPWRNFSIMYSPTLSSFLGKEMSCTILALVVLVVNVSIGLLVVLVVKVSIGLLVVLVVNVCISLILVLVVNVSIGLLVVLVVLEC